MIVTYAINPIANPCGMAFRWLSTPVMDDATLRKVARNRETVVLTTGERVTLLSWGGGKGAARARIQWPNGRQRTVKQTDVVSVDGCANPLAPGAASWAQRQLTRHNNGECSCPR